MTTCRVCGKPVVFAVVSNRQGRRPSRMPLNPAPDPAGNVAAYHDVRGTLTGRVLGKGEQPLGYERLMMPHFATCEKPAEKTPADIPPVLPPNITQLDQWRKAQASHNKAKRNRRGKRPAKPITGYRIPGRQP